MLGNILHHTDIKPLKKFTAFREALLEVDFSAHRPSRDFLHLLSYSSPHRQLVDNLRGDERGIHIEADKAAHAAEHIVALQGTVDLHL